MNKCRFSPSDIGCRYNLLPNTAANDDYDAAATASISSILLSQAQTISKLAVFFFMSVTKLWGPSIFLNSENHSLVGV